MFFFVLIFFVMIFAMIFNSVYVMLYLDPEASVRTVVQISGHLFYIVGQNKFVLYQH
uniref:Uncharacterized protein n=1 Tax=Anguilla anguilla TaxID=7936 RepID=A0A0E9PFG2_ANGAN